MSDKEMLILISKQSVNIGTHKKIGKPVSRRMKQVNLFKQPKWYKRVVDKNVN